eukprot:symbB.v1.2.014752.t1/scaffold1081.1/size139474/9
MWDGKDAGLADRLVKEQKDPRNDLTEELEEQKEALEFAKVELQEGRRREMRLNMELQAALQDSADKVEKEARGEGTTLGHRVLRAGRQLAQKTEELRSAQALGQKLHRETTLLQDELQETKERSKELQVAQIEAQKRLEKELLRRGEEKSWKLIAEEDRHSAEVLRELLERRLEESEMATLQSRRSADIFAEESQRWRMEEATEFQELRKRLAMEQAEAQRLKVSSEGVLAKAQLEIEARSAWYESEMRSAWRCEEREKQLAEQIEQGNNSRRVLEEEVVMLKEVARKRDAQWQEMFRLARAFQGCVFDASGELRMACRTCFAGAWKVLCRRFGEGSTAALEEVDGATAVWHQDEAELWAQVQQAFPHLLKFNSKGREEPSLSAIGLLHLCADVNRLFAESDKDCDGGLNMEELFEASKKIDFFRNLLSVILAAAEFRVGKDYDYSKSTIQNYMVCKGGDAAAGALKDVDAADILHERRVRWQESILQRWLPKRSPQKGPWLIIGLALPQALPEQEGIAGRKSPFEKHMDFYR